MSQSATSILNLFYKLPANLAAVFSPWNLVWHGLAIVLTYILVTTGFDWFYNLHLRDTVLYPLFMSAAVVGGLVPILLPLGLLITGWVRKNPNVLNTGFALGQAAILGSFISSLLKAVTGRAHPELVAKNVLDIGTIFLKGTEDISRQFQFGFLHGGIFWGWPSSHTTIAFAMAVTFFILYKNKSARVWALAYAFYIGLGIAATIHWFSDFAAGAIIGTLIGMVVGRTFESRSYLDQ